MNEPFSALSPAGHIVDAMWDAQLFPYQHIEFEFDIENILNYSIEFPPYFWASRVARK